MFDIRSYFLTLHKNIGTRLFVFETLIQVLLQGFVHRSVGGNSWPFLNRLGASGKEIAYLGIISGSVWNLLPLFGMISDVYPLFGYHKRWYMTIALVIGTSATVLISFLPFEVMKNFFIPAMLEFSITFGIIVPRLFNRVKVISVTNEKPIIKQHLLAYATFMLNLGSFFGYYIGIYNSSHHPVGVYRIAIPFFIVILIAVIVKTMPEEKIDNPQINWVKLNEKKELYIIAIIVAAISFVISVVAYNQERYSMLIVSLLLPCLMGGISFYFFDKEVASICMFGFFLRGLQVRTNSAYNSWVMNSQTCVQNPPELSPTFVFSIVPVVANIARVISVFIFQILLKNCKIRFLFVISFGIRILWSIPGYIMFYRVNLAWGVPDEVMQTLIILTLGFSRGLNSLGMLLLMTRKIGDDMFVPLVLIYETMGYAFSSGIGASLIDFMNIQTKTKPCNMDNFKLLMFISGVIFPSLILIAIFLLLPKMLVAGDKEEDKGSI